MKKIIIFILLLVSTTINCQIIYTYRINDEINSKTWIYTQRALNEAIKQESSLIILHLNTYGGEVVYADSIRTAILNNAIPVVVFIDNNAASAGALISLACKHIYMKKGANIGAATVVTTDGSQAPDKYQSYMRAQMRSTAESHGKDSLGRWKRDPKIAEAMVDDRIFIENIIDSGKTLTFTTEEAINYRYCEGIVENIKEIIILEGYDINKCTIQEYKPSIYDNIKGTLTGTILRSILIMIIIGGIYFEMQSPGIGFPLIASIIAALLYFAPLYIDGVAAYWEIILFVIGIILIGIELFVIPGFGFTGIIGIICVILGLGFSMIGNDYFNFKTVATEEINSALLSLFIGLIFSFSFIIWISSKIGSKGLWSKLSLNTVQNKNNGYIGVPTEQNRLIGEIGIAYTDLRPSGKIMVHNKIYDASTRYGYIEKGTHITIKEYTTGQLFVIKDTLH